MLNGRLDVMLSPPYPSEREDIAKWIPKTQYATSPTPILEKWMPPAKISPNDSGGFWLAQHVVCYQRGYFPAGLFHHYMEVAAKCFEKPVECETAGISQLAYDFFIAIVSHDNILTAGCVVEFRPAQNRSEAPYLYISTLCTDPKFGSKGLAHQLVHSVYTLGALMLEQNEIAPGIWKNAIPRNRMHLGLTVAKTEGSQTSRRLLHLYSQCGLSQSQAGKVVSYTSFTPYSVYDWQLDKEEDKIPMWQTILSEVLYEDSLICILKPNETRGVPMYHEFPVEYSKAVRLCGIVHQRHAFLHKNIKEIYTPREIEFITTRKTPQHSAFCIRVQFRDTKSKLQKCTLQISVPVWFGMGIEDPVTLN